jgi:hypothetical protein
VLCGDRRQAEGILGRLFDCLPIPVSFRLLVRHDGLR